ncbi:phage protease [Treponema pectinovorum]|uniref:phage protease n=1 Tax=Treponema pectinovorum TaxID=164 RepID=UPI0011CA6D76|nr:phage protease [Treponema pectinovorum]
MKITESLFLCLNSESGVPSRIQILPAGKEIVGVDGRKWKNSDPATLCAKMNSSDRVTVKNGCVIDENHSTDLAAPNGGTSPAFGWFRNFTVEKDGSIWADVEWNARGQKAVSDKEYKYISPVFTRDKDGNIIEILRAALTNNPNLDNPALNSSQETAEEKYMEKELCAALGLPETATTAEGLAAINSLKTELNGAREKGVDLASYAPRADLVAMQQRAEKAEKQIAELNAASLKSKATCAVEQAVKDGKIAPASKDTYLELCASEEGFAKFEKIMAATPSITGGTVVSDKTAPGANGAVELNAAEKEWASSMGYTAEKWAEIKKEGK